MSRRSIIFTNNFRLWIVLDCSESSCISLWYWNVFEYVKVIENMICVHLKNDNAFVKTTSINYDMDMLQPRAENYKNPNIYVRTDKYRRPNHKTFHEHLVELGYVNCYNVWGSAQFDRERFNGSHLRLQLAVQNAPFSKELTTSDEKWIVYNNIKRRRSIKVIFNRRKSPDWKGAPIKR